MPSLRTGTLKLISSPTCHPPSFRLNGFDLDHDLVGYKQVQTISAVQGDPFVLQRKRALPLERDLSERKFPA
jgi:hypothetical protein